MYALHVDFLAIRAQCTLKYYPYLEFRYYFYCVKITDIDAINLLT